MGPGRYADEPRSAMAAHWLAQGPAARDDRGGARRKNAAIAPLPRHIGFAPSASRRHRPLLLPAGPGHPRPGLLLGRRARHEGPGHRGELERLGLDDASGPGSRGRGQPHAWRASCSVRATRRARARRRPRTRPPGRPLLQRLGADDSGKSSRNSGEARRDNQQVPPSSQPVSRGAQKRWASCQHHPNNPMKLIGTALQGSFVAKQGRANSLSERWTDLRNASRARSYA